MRRFNLPSHLPALLTLFCYAHAAAYAQTPEVQISLSADQQQVTVGRPFLVTATITDTRRNAGNERPGVPDFGQLQVVAGPQERSQISIINGVFSSQRSITWQVVAPEEGTYAVGPTQVNIGGQVLASNALTITAGKAATPTLPQSLQDETILPPITGNPELDEALAGKIFLRTSLSTRTPYVSQPVIVKYSLVKVPGLTPRGYGEVSPNVQGALSEELYHARAVDFVQSPIDGVMFETAHILTLAVVPTSPGEFTSPGYAMEASLPRTGRGRASSTDDALDMMRRMMEDDPFFGGGGRAVRIPSADIKLNVRPLPEAGKPADFSGTVGDYTLTASVDRSSATQDDLITLTFTLVGLGAIELASAPQFGNPDFEVVGTDHKLQKKNSPESLGGLHQFQFVLSPKRTGALAIPAVTYSIFDPTKEQYRTLETQPIPLSIAPGTRQRVAAPIVQAPPAANPPGSAPPTLDNLHYIRPIEHLRRKAPGDVLASPALWGAQIAAAMIFLLSMWRRRVLLRRDPAQHRRRLAWRNFEKRLAAIQRESGRIDSQESAQRLEAATRACIADYFNLSPVGLTRQEIERLLSEQAIGQDRVQRVCDLLDQCAAVRYAPAATAGKNISEWGEEMGTLLKECFAR